MDWSNDIDVADWWIERLLPFSEHVVGSIVPAGFDAVTRVFHPLESESGGIPQRWSDVAAANGRIAHAEMQLHRIASQAGEPRSDDVPFVETSGLPLPEAHVLSAILGEHGSTGAIWFGCTTIASNFDGALAAEVRPAGTQQRQFFLIRGTLAGFDDVCRYANDCTLDSPGLLVPTVWWPEDRSWFVAGDADFAWTYVAGPSRLIQTIESSPQIEAFRTGYDRSHTVDADTVNAP